ncbi:RIIa domain-containing protein 1 isoform X1 [Engystomops pustulosus]|uniref:RIIa domain-containing protein 1 isoform X1 n=1 Tax=Engystomops pustulosus TaxID=76066 RepID=UPI003AFA71E4
MEEAAALSAEQEGRLRDCTIRTRISNEEYLRSHGERSFAEETRKHSELCSRLLYRPGAARQDPGAVRPRAWRTPAVDYSRSSPS